jgi:hypothetical protein
MGQPFCCNAKCRLHGHLMTTGAHHVHMTEAAGKPLLATGKAKAQLDKEMYPTDLPSDDLVYQINPASFGMKLNASPMAHSFHKGTYGEAMKYKTIMRHKVNMYVEGMLLEDWLCEVCFEVWNMVHPT